MFRHIVQVKWVKCTEFTHWDPSCPQFFIHSQLGFLCRANKKNPSRTNSSRHWVYKEGECPLLELKSSLRRSHLCSGWCGEYPIPTVIIEEFWYFFCSSHSHHHHFIFLNVFPLHETIFLWHKVGFFLYIYTWSTDSLQAPMVFWNLLKNFRLLIRRSAVGPQQCGSWKRSVVLQLPLSLLSSFVKDTEDIKFTTDVLA